MIRRDLTGQRFGRLVAISPKGINDGRKGFIWAFRCDCGREVERLGAEVSRGRTSSCGCLRDELRRTMQKTHGLTQTPEWMAWSAMRQRCENPKHKAYANYGGRGISVCDQWSDFEAFLADVGARPTASHSLDRIDNDGNYEPGNCRWATRTTQGRNRRTNNVITAFGTSKLLCGWAQEIGIAPQSLGERLAKGLTPEEAITMPKYHEQRTRPYRVAKRRSAR